MSDLPRNCTNPQCGHPLHPGDVFCMHCGRLVASMLEEVTLTPDSVLEGGEKKAEPPKEAVKFDTSLQPLLQHLKLVRADLGAAPGSPLPARSATPPVTGAVEPSSQTGPATQPPSDCEDLVVRYNNSCVFVLGMQSTFDFQIRPVTDGIRELEVEVRQSGRRIAVEKPAVLPRRGVPLFFGLNYAPRNTQAGKVSFEIRISYMKGTARKSYAAYRTHTLFSGKEDPRQVCDRLVVEVKNNIQQGHAGDLSVDQSFEGLREALRQRNSIEIDHEFLQLINARPYWAALPLAECTGEAPAAEVSFKAQRLVLRSPQGLCAHLLSLPLVRMGRARECEILARVLDISGRQLNEESLRISRFHACFEWQGNQCRLVDRGYYSDAGRWRPSTTGVWVDDQRLPSGGEFFFAPGRAYSIKLSDPQGGTASCYALKAQLWLVKDLPNRTGCPDLSGDEEAPACLTLQRTDGAGEHYVLVRTAANLGWLDSRLAQACVCLRNGAFYLSQGDACDPLIPGRTLRAGTVEFRITGDPTPSS